MALKDKKGTATLNKADGFGNLSFTDTKGKVFRLPKGVPLHDSDGGFSAWLLEQTRNNPNFSIQMTLKVQLVGEDVVFEAPTI